MNTDAYESPTARFLSGQMTEFEVGAWLSPRPTRSSRKHRGRLFTSPSRRQTLLLTAAAVLAGVLILALLLAAAPDRTSGTTRGGTPKAGVVPLIAITGPGTGSQPAFDRPLGAAFGEGGRIYVSDTGNDRVCVFDAEGRYLFSFGGLGVAKPLAGAKKTWRVGRLNSPAGITVSDTGEVYVADFRNDQICVFDAEGKYLRRFPDPTQITGKGGSGQEGRGIAVTDVAVRTGRVLATDTYQVFAFTAAGALASQFGKPGAGPTDLDHPNGIDVSGSGTIYVSDSNHVLVKAFNPDGTLVWVFGPGTRDSMVRDETGLQLPRGLAVDADGTVLVADAFGHQIIRLSAKGKQLAKYGSRGTAPAEFNFPNDVDVHGGRVLVTDKENNRVLVVELED